MKKNIEPTNEQIITTNKAYDLRDIAKTDDELAEMLGISKVTLYTRFRLSNWKKSEIALVDNIHSYANEKQ